VTIGILGGTGPAGQALAARLASIDEQVLLGSRDAERAAGVVAELRGKWPEHRLSLEGVANEDACKADIVVLATPWEGAAPLAADLRERLDGKVLISMVNALERVGSELQALMPPRGSIAVAVQQAAPGALVAGAFHHVPARGLADLNGALEADVLVCSDHAAATETTIDLVSSIPGCRGIDAGSLSAAAAIEAFTAVLIGINVKHRVHASIRLTGFGPRGGNGASSR
jgi:NADPH-dependent F420 reductase